jgi:hypothetical protein
MPFQVTGQFRIISTFNNDFEIKFYSKIEYASSSFLPIKGLHIIITTGKTAFFEPQFP